MVSRTFVAACGFAAALCLSSAAQSASAPAAQTKAPAQAQPAPKLELQSLAPEPTTPSAAQIAERRQQQAVAMALRLANIQARWGAPMSTPGLSIQLVETGKARLANGETQLQYHISGSGFTPADKLQLVSWPLDSHAMVLMDGIGFNSKGIAVCADAPLPPVTTGAGNGAVISAPSVSAPTPHLTEKTAGPQVPSCAKTMKTGEPVTVSAVVAAGEPVRVALLARTQRRGAATTTVPFPIENVSQGCRLQVILGMKDGGMVLVDGSGFPASTPLKLSSITNGQTRNLNSTTNDKGRMVFVLLPQAKGHASGEMTVRFDGVIQAPSLDPADKAPTPNPTCRPAVTFHWGQGSYKPE